MKMTSDIEYSDVEGDDEIDYGPSKSQIKRECNHLVDVGEEILKLSREDIDSLGLPPELEEAVHVALKIKSRSGLKRQRQYIGKLLRNMDSEGIESRLSRIQHRHDTNTAVFKRLEKWRDDLIENNRETMNEVIARYPSIDRQHLNQLVRAAHQEKIKEKAPAASRKLFKYLREQEDLLAQNITDSTV